MRKFHLLDQLDFIGFATTVTGRGPFANTIHGKNRGGLIRRWKKGGGRVRFVMLRKKDRAGKRKFSGDVVLHPYLFLQPDRHRFEERTQPFRRKRKISVQQAIELQERFFVKRDDV